MTPPPRPHRVPGRQALLRAEGLVPRPRRPRPPGGAAAQPCGWDQGATRPPRAASARAETEPPGASGTVPESAWRRSRSLVLGAVSPKGDELGRVRGGVPHAGQTTAACCAFHLSRFIRLPNVVKEQTRLMTGGHSAAPLGTPEEVRFTELPGRLHMLCGHGAGCWGHPACVPCPFLLWPQALNWPAPPTHTHTHGDTCQCPGTCLL